MLRIYRGIVMEKNRLKKELIPIAALLVFIVAVLILCAVSAGRKKKDAQTADMAGTEDAVLQEEPVADSESGGAGQEETGISLEVRETIEVTEEIPADSVSGNGEAAGNKETAESGDAELISAADTKGTGVSGNDAQKGTDAVSSNGLSGEIVKKTNVEMLAEMMDYWARENVEAVQDLGGLGHYRKMSASLDKPGSFYYYGERDDQNRPDGMGIAVYGGDQYYYGSWKAGMRDGEGMWLRMYYEGCSVPAGVNTLLNPMPVQTSVFGQESVVRPDPALICHSYRGNWSANLPNGEGHEQFEIDREKIAEGSRYFQNIMGNFKGGLYDGKMYIMTLDWAGNVQEWNGKASEGTFETLKGRDQEGRVPICQNVLDADSHLWIRPLENRNLGIAELVGQ